MASLADFVAGALIFVLLPSQVDFPDQQENFLCLAMQLGALVQNTQKDAEVAVRSSSSVVSYLLIKARIDLVLFDSCYCAYYCRTRRKRASAHSCWAVSRITTNSFTWKTRASLVI